MLRGLEARPQPGSRDGLWERQDQGPMLPGVRRLPVQITHSPEVLAFLITPSTRVFRSGLGRAYIMTGPSQVPGPRMLPLHGPSQHVCSQYLCTAGSIPGSGSQHFCAGGCYRLGLRDNRPTWPFLPVQSLSPVTVHSAHLSSKPQSSMNMAEVRATPHWHHWFPQGHSEGMALPTQNADFEVI